MKCYFVVFLIGFVAAVKAADNEYVVTQTGGAYIILNNGIPLAINQGSCFLFVKDDSSHTFTQLRVGDSTFWIRKANVSIVPNADNQAAATKYDTEVRLATQIV